MSASLEGYGAARTIRRPIEWLRRHDSEANAFELGVSADGTGYMAVSLFRGAGSFGKLHMTWQSPGIMLRYVYGKRWDGVPFYWQNQERYTVDPFHTAGKGGDGRTFHVGDLVLFASGLVTAEGLIVAANVG